MKRVILLILVLSLLITVSCSNNNEDVNNELLEELQQKNKELTEENENLKQIIEELSTKETLSSEDNDTDDILENYREYNKDCSKDSNMHWLNENKWDKILIYNEGEFDNNNITITDNKILSIKPVDITGTIKKVETDDENNDEGINYYDGDDEVKYVYIFKSGDKSYKIEVVSDNIVMINGKTYETENNTIIFGEGLIASKYNYKTDSFIEKALNSKLCVKKKYSVLIIKPDGTYEVSDNYIYNYYFDNSFYKDIIAATTNSMKKINRPLLSDTINCFPKGELTYYYYGEYINVDVYYNYLHIYNSDEELWYETKPAYLDYFKKLIEELDNY